jgi:hypothetical protein
MPKRVRAVKITPGLGRFVQNPDDVVGGDHLHDPARHAHPRVVVDDVEDLEHLAVGQWHVGHVGLPALVG